MENGEERASLRDEGDRELFAIRREERELVAEERAFERGLEALEEDEHRVERQIDAEWRKEHWGHEPEHPPSWRADNGERRPPARAVMPDDPYRAGALRSSRSPRSRPRPGRRAADEA